MLLMALEPPRVLLMMMEPPFVFCKTSPVHGMSARKTKTWLMDEQVTTPPPPDQATVIHRTCDYSNLTTSTAGVSAPQTSPCAPLLENTE